MVTDNTNQQADDTTAFLRAARSGNLEKVIEYIDTDLDINTANSNGLNALHLASKDGYMGIVTELLKRGAKVDAATKKGNTALHIASLAGQAEIVNLLLQYGAAVNVQSQNGFTPLYMAAQENHDHVVKILLCNGANQSLATEDGFTPLAVAMQQGHDKVVSVLLENDSKGKVRLPALHIAAKKDDSKAADLLLQNDHKPDVTSKSGFTPLHIAAHYGNEDIARLLIKRGADVNYLAKHNISPLHVAAKWGKNNMVKVLLESSAMIDAKTRDGLTPLHCAARSGHDQVVSTLLDNSAPISARTKNGLAPLHMASQGDHVDAARVLLYHRAPVDEVTIDYLTSLHVAAHCGHVRVAKLLLDRKADPNARALNGFTPLHIACKKNRIKVVELLLKHGASIESTTESGLTPLHVASFMGCMNIVIFLLQHEANPDVPTVRGETPLHLAARANQTDIIRILLRNGAKVDARAREQQTPLHIASRLGNVDIVMLLLQHGAVIDTTTKDMYTALHIAAKEGQEEVAAILVENNASLKATTKNGFTPLHVAAKYGNINVTKILLQKDSTLNFRGKNDITPLHMACHYDHPSVVTILLEKGASPHAASQNGHTPLHIAARKNQMDIASILLEHGADANIESKAGFTPLHLSSQKGHYDMTNLLIEHEADPNHKAKNGLTALHLCAQEDFIRVASIVVKNGANVESETETGYRPIHVAAHFGNLSMIRFLLKHNAEIDVKTNQNYTPLHLAAQQGHAHVASALLERNASHRARTNDGLTALNIAQKLGYISVMEVLKGLPYDSLIPNNKNWEEKYRVIAPESLQETNFMSDTDDEGGSDALINEQPYRYLTADLMKSLRDDSLPIDVTRDDPIHRQVSKEEKQKFVQSSNYCSAENFEMQESMNLGKLHFTPFLVSFIVDARGGAMKGCRHSGIRLIVPPRRATMPIRVMCKLVKPNKIPNPPPLMEGEALATRIIEMGPVGAKFLGPVSIDVPHFASLRGKERETIILRSENGESWKEYDNSNDNDDTLLNAPYDSQMSASYSGRITRIITSDFPQYFAIVTRIKQEVHIIGAEGGILISSVVSHVQVVFPPGALTKKIKVGLQAHVISTELTAKLLGNCVAVSPVITIEPRRRKFHKPITLTIPVPQAANKGMINKYGGETPTLRLLCSIAGGTSESQWEDVTGSTPLTFMNGRVSFTTTVSARFWLMDCRNIGEIPKMATDLYKESLFVPFITNFVIYSKRMDLLEATLRTLYITDGKEGMHTLEKQEKFFEIVKSRDVEALDGKDLYIEFSGNLVPITKSGVQLKFTFKAFHQNRLSFHMKVKDPLSDPVARMLFMREPKVVRGEPPQQPICVLNVVLPEKATNVKKERNKDNIDFEDSNVISQRMDVFESNYQLEYEEKSDVPKSTTSPSERKFIIDTLQKERTDAPIIHESIAQRKVSRLQSIDASFPDNEVDERNNAREEEENADESVTLERQSYSEKRKFWEDITRKRESYRRSESEVSRTSQLTINESDSECTQNAPLEKDTEAVEKEDEEEDEKDANVPDISEHSVAEKAHYFEEQIQKEITLARLAPKVQLQDSLKNKEKIVQKGSDKATDQTVESFALTLTLTDRGKEINEKEEEGHRMTLDGKKGSRFEETVAPKSSSSFARKNEEKSRVSGEKILERILVEPVASWTSERMSEETANFESLEKVNEVCRNLLNEERKFSNESKELGANEQMDVTKGKLETTCISKCIEEIVESIPEKKLTYCERITESESVPMNEVTITREEASIDRSIVDVSKEMSEHRCKDLTMDVKMTDSIPAREEDVRENSRRKQSSVRKNKTMQPFENDDDEQIITKSKVVREEKEGQSVGEEQVNVELQVERKKQVVNEEKKNVAKIAEHMTRETIECVDEEELKSGVQTVKMISEENETTRREEGEKFLVQSIIKEKPLKVSAAAVFVQEIENMKERKLDEAIDVPTVSQVREKQEVACENERASQRLIAKVDPEADIREINDRFVDKLTNTEKVKVTVEAISEDKLTDVSIPRQPDEPRIEIYRETLEREIKFVQEVDGKLQQDSEESTTVDRVCKVVKEVTKRRPGSKVDTKIRMEDTKGEICINDEIETKEDTSKMKSDYDFSIPHEETILLSIFEKDKKHTKHNEEYSDYELKETKELMPGSKATYKTKYDEWADTCKAVLETDDEGRIGRVKGNEKEIYKAKESEAIVSHLEKELHKETKRIWEKGEGERLEASVSSTENEDNGSQITIIERKTSNVVLKSEYLKELKIENEEYDSAEKFEVRTELTEKEQKELEKEHLKSCIPNISEGKETTEKDQGKDFLKKTEFESYSISKTMTSKKGKEKERIQEIKSQESKRTNESQSKILPKSFMPDPKEVLNIFEDTRDIKQEKRDDVAVSNIDQRSSSKMEEKEMISLEMTSGSDREIIRDKNEYVEKKTTSKVMLTMESPSETMKEKTSETRRSDMSVHGVKRTRTNVVDEGETIDVFAGRGARYQRDNNDDEDDDDNRLTKGALKRSLKEISIVREKDFSWDESTTQIENARAQEEKLIGRKEENEEEIFRTSEDRQKRLVKEFEARNIAKTIVQSIESEIEKRYVATAGDTTAAEKTVETGSKEYYSKRIMTKFDDPTKQLEDTAQRSGSDRSEAINEQTEDINKVMTFGLKQKDVSQERDSTRDSISISEDLTRDEESSPHDKEDGDDDEEKEESLPLSSSRAKLQDRDITLSPSSMSDQAELEESMDVEENKFANSTSKDQHQSVKELALDLEPVRRDLSHDEANFDVTIRTSAIISKISGARVLEIVEPAIKDRSRQLSVTVDRETFLETDESAFDPKFDKTVVEPGTVSKRVADDDSWTQEDYVSMEPRRDSLVIKDPPLSSPRTKLRGLEIKPVDWMIGDKKIEISETLQPSQAFDKELEEYQHNLDLVHTDYTVKRESIVQRQCSVKSGSKFTVTSVSNREFEDNDEDDRLELNISKHEYEDNISLIENSKDMVNRRSEAIDESDKSLLEDSKEESLLHDRNFSTKGTSLIMLESSKQNISTLEMGASDIRQPFKEEYKKEEEMEDGAKGKRRIVRGDAKSLETDYREIASVNTKRNTTSDLETTKDTLKTSNKLEKYEVTLQLDKNVNKREIAVHDTNDSGDGITANTRKDNASSVDLSARYAITVLNQVVKKEIAEVKESLKAAKQDLIEELGEHGEIVYQIKDSPSEFQFKLQSESTVNNLPFLTEVSSVEQTSEYGDTTLHYVASHGESRVESTAGKTETIEKNEEEGLSTKVNAKASDLKEEELRINVDVISETVKSESQIAIHEKERVRYAEEVEGDEEEGHFSSVPASRFGSDIDNKDNSSSSVPLRFSVSRRKDKATKATKKVTSESEADIGSSSGESSNYQSCDYEIGSGSRPSSSDIEALQPNIPSGTVSEYETALMSIGTSTTSRPTSQEYHTAASSLSSRESIKSLNSLSSGHLGSIDSMSEMSETLIPSLADVDRANADDNLDEFSGLDDDNVVDHHVVENATRIPDSPRNGEPTGDAFVEAIDDVPCRMKRSSEMIFQQEVIGESDELTVEPIKQEFKCSNSATSTLPHLPSSAVQSVDIMTSRISEDGVQSVCTQVISKASPEMVAFDGEALIPTVDSKGDVTDQNDTTSSKEPFPIDVAITITPESSTSKQESFMSTSSTSGMSVDTVIEKETQLDRCSPDSDSFELVDKPDIIDDFVVVEEVGKEAEEFDSEGKSIRIGVTSYVINKNYDRDLDNLIAETTKKNDSQLPSSQTSRSNGLFDFESEASPPQISNDEQYSQSNSDEEQYDQGGKKWIEMQFHADPRVYDIEYDRGPLEDIKEEEITDFEAGSSRFGSLGSHKGSIGSVGSMHGSFGSTPDYDVLAGKKYFTRPSDHDNVSLSSLQEFESLESAVALENARRLQCGSQDSINNVVGSSGVVGIAGVASGSLSRNQATGRSGHGDDISLSSLKDFEGLESACREAHMIELRAREEQDLLEHESPESRYGTLMMERLPLRSKAESCATGSGSDDYERRIREIDEIIRIAQSNVEKFEQQNDTTEDISQIEMVEVDEEGDGCFSKTANVAAIVPMVSDGVNTGPSMDSANVMESSTDSLELNDNADNKHRHPLCRSSDSLEMKTTIDFPSLSSDSLNNVRDPREAQVEGGEADAYDNARRISSDSLDVPLLEQGDTAMREEHFENNGNYSKVNSNVDDLAKNKASLTSKTSPASGT